MILSGAAANLARLLERDLREIFGNRLGSLSVYRPATDAPDTAVHTMVTVDSLGPDDLRACADRMGRWVDAGLATPLIVPTPELSRSLDAFPLEFAAIRAEHVLVAGDDPFVAVNVDDHDLRRACEVQARSHLLHLREGFIETEGRGDRVAALVSDSAQPLAGLVKSVARLLGSTEPTIERAAGDVEQAAGLPAGCLSTAVAANRAALTADAARRRFAEYLDAIEQLTRFIDGWSRR